MLKFTLCWLLLLALPLELASSTHDKHRVSQEPSPALPQPTGPFALGTQVFQIVDASRRDPNDPSRPREMCVQIWFPAEHSKDSQAPYLVDNGLLGAMKKFEYLDLPPEVFDQWNNLRTHAHFHAQIVASPTTLPLILFSPGFGVSRVNYTALVEELASHGVIVLTVDHPYAGLTVFPDGRVLSFSPADGGDDALRLRVEDMARDAVFILESVLQSNAGLGQFSTRVDRKHITVAGHSLGGMMALEALRQDGRFLSAIDFDGSPVGKATLEGLSRPILVMLNQPDHAHRPPPEMKAARRKEWTDLIEKKHTPSILVTVGNTTHMSFSDAAFVVPPERLAKSGGVIDAHRLLEIITRAVLAFTGPAVPTEKAPRVRNTLHAYSEAEVETFNMEAEQKTSPN
jgi:dienelactone hydrolase